MVAIRRLCLAISMILSAFLISSLTRVWIDYGDIEVLGYQLPWDQNVWSGLSLDPNSLVPDLLISKVLLAYSAPLIGFVNLLLVLHMYFRSRHEYINLTFLVTLNVVGIIFMVLLKDAGPCGYTTCVDSEADNVSLVFVLYILISLALTKTFVLRPSSYIIN